MSKSVKNEFMELLLLNNQIMLKEFLISKGKAPKAVCPIEFVNEDNIDEENYNNENY